MSAARLQADQAEADTRVARAKAEGRRAMAVAREQEMIAGVEESRAALVEAEEEVPKATSIRWPAANSVFSITTNLRICRLILK